MQICCREFSRNLHIFGRAPGGDGAINGGNGSAPLRDAFEYE
jgi:hypothetical protein